MSNKLHFGEKLNVNFKNTGGGVGGGGGQGDGNQGGGNQGGGGK